MGMDELREERRAKRKKAKLEAPDPLGELLGVVEAWAREYADDHPREKPPSISCGWYQGSNFLTLSLPTAQKSCSGWGATWTRALEQLEERLEAEDPMVHFKPWKSASRVPTAPI